MAGEYDPAVPNQDVLLYDAPVLGCSFVLVVMLAPQRAMCPGVMAL